MVSTLGHPCCNKAQWIRLEGMLGGNLAVLNFYVSTIIKEWCELLKELLATLSYDCRWALCGDFNFVERTEDKSNLSGRLISNGKSRIFYFIHGCSGGG